MKPFSRFAYIFLWLAIAAGCVMRIYYVHLYNPIEALWPSDPMRHWLNGTNPLDTSPLPMANPIGFQLWIGLVAKLTLAKPQLTFLYAAVMSLLAPWVWYRFMREVFSSKALALLGWAILLWLPSWLDIFSVFMSETLFIPLLGASLWMSWRCLRKKTFEPFLTMSIFWTATGITRGTVIPMAAVVTAWIWWRQEEKFRRAYALVALLAPTLGFLGYRSYIVTGMVTPVGSNNYDYVYARSGRKMIKLYYNLNGKYAYDFYFSSPSMDTEPLAPLSSWRSHRQDEEVITIELTDEPTSWAVAKKAAREAGGAWLPWAFDGMMFLFFGKSWPDDNVERLCCRLNIASRWMWAPLTLIMIVGLLWRLRDARERERAGLLLGLFAAWLLVQGFMPVAVNVGRYRKPMEGYLIASVLVLFDRRPKSMLHGLTAAESPLPAMPIPVAPAISGPAEPADPTLKPAV
ncbi:MAG: glycosyltransferase family 39 protein [Verrucomicrobiota bacterium]|nr:glycosyltransferase family 39 protein [Verrucomicrobiota bacterium]